MVLRVGWRYRVFKHDELIRPIEVIFETPFHHPRIRTKENSEDFAASKERLVALPDNSARLRGVLPYLTVNGPLSTARIFMKRYANFATGIADCDILEYSINHILQPISSSMVRRVENKALVNFTTNEAAILDSIEKSKAIPSKNEAWRRGIEAVNLLLDTNESALFDVLSNTLYAAASEVNNQKQLVHHLAQGQAVANAVQATLISKKGLPAAEFMDAFTATLRDLSLLSDPKSYREADMKELESTLYGMARLASRYASPSPTPSLVSRSKVPH